MTKVLKDTIKKAMQNYRENYKNYGGHKFYLDLATGELWIDWYVSANDWTEYKDKNIIEVPVGHAWSHFGTTKAGLEWAVEDLNKCGFEVEVIA